MDYKYQTNKSQKIYKRKYISLLNKISHKPLLLKNIFTYSEERPYVFQYLLGNDSEIKKSLKKSFESLKKTNNVTDINSIIYKFVVYRLLYEIKLLYEYLNDYEEKEEDISEKSLIKFFSKKIKRIFNLKISNKNVKININMKIMNC